MKETAGQPDQLTRRGQKTRARLVDAAIEEFSAKGFHDAKVSDIVSRCGLTQPTFYLYFDSKEAIYHHLLERVRREVTVVIANAKIPDDAPRINVREKLSAAIEAFLQYFVDNPKLAPLGYFDPDHNAALRDEIVALVSRNVAFEQGAGFCRPELDPVFLSQCYNGSLERLIRVYLLTGKYSARALSDLIADLYGHGTIPGHPDLSQNPSQSAS